jgi:soluble lytic murein transglycosylase-like protein
MPVDTMTTASIGAVALPTAPAADGQYSAIVARYAASYGVPVTLAQAVIRIESNYRPNMVGSAGEIGLMQIKPATARMMGYSGSAKGLFDPDTNIKYGMKYLAMAQDLGGGTTCGTILKYNAGHAATRMNPVSAAYCSKVKVQMAAL